MTAQNGREALEIFTQRADDLQLVVLDLTMPVLGGENALREMRAIRSDLKAILMSGYNERDLAEQSWGGNPPGFIQKPFRGSLLKDTVRAALSAESPPSRPSSLAISAAKLVNDQTLRSLAD